VANVLRPMYGTIQQIFRRALRSGVRGRILRSEPTYRGGGDSLDGDGDLEGMSSSSIGRVRHRRAPMSSGSSIPEPRRPGRRGTAPAAHDLGAIAFAATVFGFVSLIGDTASMYACRPFFKYWPQSSACLPQTTMLCHSVRSCRAPARSLNESLVANVNLATVWPTAGSGPLGRDRGCRPELPCLPTSSATSKPKIKPRDGHAQVPSLSDYTHIAEVAGDK